MALTRPNFVQPGDRIVIDVRGGSDETLAWDTIVLDDCGGQGYWYCDTCRISLSNNMEMSGHSNEHHRLAWICFEHGPETVKPT